MIKLFRKLRLNLLSEGKAGKYFKYAIGEIVLVVIGILIALAINNWNERNNDNKLKMFYMKSLVNDLISDSLDINRVIKWQKKDLELTRKYLNRIYLNPSSTIDTIIQIGKNEFNSSFLVKREYNNNTFKTIISSGNIKLLNKELIDKLMELNSLQIDQLKRTESNLGIYINTYTELSTKYPTYNSLVPKKNIINEILWNNINEKEFVGLFISTIEQRMWTFENTVEGHINVKNKIKEILELTEELLKK